MCPLVAADAARKRDSVTVPAEPWKAIEVLVTVGISPGPGATSEHATTGRLTEMALYDAIGTTYAVTRRPDPRVEALLWQQLDGCQSGVNVGAGSGNYEAQGRVVVAVEPSVTMIRQRRPGSAAAELHPAPAVLRRAGPLAGQWHRVWSPPRRPASRRAGALGR